MPPLDAFALAAVVLSVKMFAVALFQGYMRTKHDRFARPEDAETYGSGEVADSDLAVVDRAQRALRNDVENIPIFLVLAWCFVAMNIYPAACAVYFGIFAAARIAHTVFYLRPLQPYRTISYTVGTLVSLTLSGHIVYAILAG